MFESVFQAFERLVTDFSWRRLLFWVLFVTVLGGSFMIFERYTGQFKLRKLERATALLERLETLRQHPSVFQDSALAATYRGIRDQLGDLLKPADLRPSVSPIVWRGMAAAAPWLLIALAFVPGLRRGEAGMGSAVVGVLIIGIVFAGIGVLLPDSFGELVLYVVYPGGSFLGFLIVALGWQASRNRAIGGPRAAVATLKSDLRNLVTAQEAYFADNVKYAETVATLGFIPSPGVQIRSLVVSGDGWWAIASHEYATKEYGIRIGTVEGRLSNLAEGVPSLVGPA